MAPRSDLLDHYKLDADQRGESVIHYSYRSDRACGLRKVKVEEQWDNIRPIGYGSFGEVWQQTRNSSNEQRAVKVLRKRKMKTWGIHYEREIEALAKFNKAQFRQEEVIVQFFGWWESEHSVHLAMEYFEMGDLSNFISEAKTSEQDAKNIAEDLLRALLMIHSQGFTHRDLKPQNILVVQTSPKYWVKLGDFGISKRVMNQSTALRTEVGTRAFSAPETTPDDYEETFQYTNAVDMWSLGCVIYNVLAHSLPYKNSHAKSLPFRTQPLKDRVDDQGIDFLECLLRVDPSTRWTAQKAAQHPWLEASSEASSAVAEDAAGHASSVAQSGRPNECQAKGHRPDDQVDMPTFISRLEKTCPKPADQIETPIDQLTSQSSGHREKNVWIDSSSDNASRRKPKSNVLVSPFTYKISDYLVVPGTKTLKPRKAGYRKPKDISRGLHERDTTKPPTASPVMPTVVSRSPNIGLGTSYSSSNDVSEGSKKELNYLNNVRRRHKSEEQFPEKMKLVNTLRNLYTQEGPPDQKSIVRALRLIRKGLGLEMRSDGETALHLAVRIYYSKKGGYVTQILHVLLERGADVDALDELGETALHKVLIFSRSCRNHNENEIEVVRLLLRYRANVNAKNHSSFTPLHYAAWSCSGEYIDVLLAAGARVDELDNDGETALHWAVFNEDQGEIVARKLILAGIDIDVIDKGGRTALDIARDNMRSSVIEVIEEAKVQLRRSPRNRKNAQSGRCNAGWL